MMEDAFKHLHVEFYMDKRENPRRSAEQGRPIFEDIEMVKIRIAGDPKTIHTAPANDASSARDPVTNERLPYAKLHSGPYEAFKKGLEYHGSGTPLSEAPFISKAKSAELKALNVYTVEQLAELDGSNLARLGMGGRTLKDQATAYLGNASGSADVVKLAGENAELKERLARLEAMMSDAPPETDDEPTDDDGPTPFDDWDIDTIEAWYKEQGGSFDKRWSLSTAIKKAATLNDELARAKEAA